jgi:hypothetical protein
MTRRALLEDTKLPAPVILPEILYLELTIGQMSAQESTLFEFPCIGDDLNIRDDSKKLRYTLDRLKAVVDRCSNPPHFCGVKTPITELLEPEPLKPNPKNARDKKDDKDAKGRLHSRASEKTEKTADKKRPAHEHLSSRRQEDHHQRVSASSVR